MLGGELSGSASLVELQLVVPMATWPLGLHLGWIEACSPAPNPFFSPLSPWLLRDRGQDKRQCLQPAEGSGRPGGSRL